MLGHRGFPANRWEEFAAAKRMHRDAGSREFFLSERVQDGSFICEESAGAFAWEVLPDGFLTELKTR